ncbi:MAG: chorismate mutase [Alphaproteobacteria bacterium]
MTENGKQMTLAEVREELDRLDAAMHELLMARTEVVRGVAEAKRQANGDGKVGFAVRPGREAQMMRAFLKRHQGELPFKVVARLWREIINAMTRLQNALAVAIVDEDAVGHDDFVRRYDLVRSHWGTVTPITRYADAAAMLAALDADQGIMGVVDVTGRGTDWWRALVDFNIENPDRRRFIVAPLPFFHEPGADEIEGYAVSPMPPEQSGDDVTLLAGVMTDQALQACDVVRADDVPATAGLVALDGFFDQNDDVLAQLAEQVGAPVHYLGAFARPLAIG